MSKKKSETTKEPPIKELSKKSNAGRETKLNKEMIDEIASYIELGFTIKDTCEAVGINKATFFEWKKQGKSDKENGIKSDFSEFSDSIKKGRNVLKREMISKITMASNMDWKAAAWWLERNFPEDYSLKPELRQNKKKANLKKNVNLDINDIIEKLNESFDEQN